MRWTASSRPAAARLARACDSAVPEMSLPHMGSRETGRHRACALACSACHARNVGGNGDDIYNPKGRINTPGLLRGMVDYCSTQLNLGFFPEDTTAVAAVLNREHYKFMAK